MAELAICQICAGGDLSLCRVFTNNTARLRVALCAGRIILGGLERLFNRVPFINTVYRTVKQIVDTFGQQKKAVFQEVVLIEYPRKRCYVLGFLTNTAKGETQASTGEHIVNVFVPTTPNPTSGFLLMLPE